MLGHIDPASRKFIPDVSSIKDDTILLKKLIKQRAILGYIDPLTLKFVKEQPPLSQGTLSEACLHAQKYVGVAQGIKVILTFVDPHHASLAQIVVAGTQDFDLDSALLQKRGFVGEISPLTLNFLPDMFIEGIDSVTLQQALENKITSMNYKLKTPPLTCLGEDSSNGTILFGFQVSLDDRNSKLPGSPSKHFSAQ